MGRDLGEERNRVGKEEIRFSCKWESRKVDYLWLDMRLKDLAKHPGVS